MISRCAYIKISYEESRRQNFCYCRKHRIREQYEQETRVTDLLSGASENGPREHGRPDEEER